MTRRGDEDEDCIRVWLSGLQPTLFYICFCFWFWFWFCKKLHDRSVYCVYMIKLKCFFYFILIVVPRHRQRTNERNGNDEE